MSMVSPSAVSIALALALPASALAQVPPYSEDFEALQIGDPQALASTGWLAFGNVFDPGGGFLFSYGPFPAPNGGQAFSEVIPNSGTPAQGQQQLLVLSDYLNSEHGNGNLVEANVFQERIIDAAAVGKTFELEFDARNFDLQAPTTALAFIKVIDAQSFTLNELVTVDTSALTQGWDTFTAEVTIDPSYAGDLLQFGFSNLTTSFVQSGVLYDNVRFEEKASAPGPTFPNAPQGPSDADEWELPVMPPSAPGFTCGDAAPPFEAATPSSRLDRIDPVLLHNGEFSWAETDLEWWFTAGDRMKWRRRYRSRLGRPTPMGVNWDHSWNVYLEPLGASGIALHDGNNYVHRMQPTPGAPSVLAEPGFSASLTQAPDGSWTLLFADGATWQFAALDGSPVEGKLLTSTDRVGKQITLAYDASGRLTGVADSIGRSLALTYNAQGLVQSVTDPEGRQVSYGYSAAGDLVAVTSPAVVGTPNGNDFPAGKTTTYTYSSGFSAEELNHNLLTITNGEGQTWLTNVYGTGPRRALRDRVLRNVYGNPADVNDFRYFRVPRARSISGEVVTAVVNDRMGNVSHHSYDGRNRPVRHETFTGRAASNQRTTLTQNRPSGKLRPSDPDSFVIERFWNDDDREVLTVYPAGGSVARTFEFDLDPLADPRARGNLRVSRQLPGPLGGDQAVLEDRFTYAPGLSGCCGVDFVTSHIDPAGFEMQHDYDAVGNRIRTTYPVAGVEEEWTYDARGRVLSHLHADTAPQARRLDTFEYLPEQGGADSGRRLRAIVDSQGLALTRTFAYDVYGNVSVITDPSGADTRIDFNALDQPVRMRSPEATPGANDRGETTMAYDAADRLVSTEELRQGADLASTTTVRTQYTRDALGRVTLSRVQEGGVLLSSKRYEFDGNGQLVRRRTQLAGGGSADEILTEYDERKLVLRTTQAPGTASETVTEFAYDGHSRLTREQVTGGGSVWHDRFIVNDGYGRAVQWTDGLRATQVFTTYEPRGLRASVQVLGQKAVDGDLGDVVPMQFGAYTYDEMGRLLGTAIQHFDVDTGLPVGDGVSTTTYAYAGRSQLRSMTDDLNGVMRFEYDSAHRKVATVDQKGDRVDLGLDSRGNPVVTARTSFPDTGGQPEVLVYQADFDGRSRVIATVDPLGAISTFTYDSRGALTSSVDRNGNREVLVTDGLGRDLRTEQVMTDTGNGAGTEVARIVRTRTYDRAGRVRTSTDANGNTVTFEYDVMGRVTSRTLADGSAFTTVYQGPALLRTEDADGTIIERQYADGILHARTVLQAGPGVAASNEQFTMDGLGRPVVVSDDDTTVTFQYDSMGNAVRETLDVSAGQVSFTGQTSSSYDGLGGLVSLTYPGGRSLQYELRHVAGRAEVQAIFEAGQELASFAYLGARLERREVSLGQQGEPVRSFYGFDGRGALANELHAAGPQQAPLAVLDHQYDPSENLVGYVEQVLGRSHSMGYDSADRLVRSDHVRANNVTEQVTYDLDLQGNRLQVIGGPDAGAYAQDPSPPAADAQVNQYTQTPSDSRVYSATGNLTARTPVNGQSVTNAFDHAGRVVQSGSTTMLYDALGRLVFEDGPGGNRSAFFHLGGRMIEEERWPPPPGATSRIWIWGGGGAPIASRSGSAGDVILLNSPNVGVLGSVSGGGPFGTPFGTLVERYDYGDQGRVLDAFTGFPLQDSVVGNRYFFRGLRHDLANGHVMVGSTRIDPSVGRSINRAGGIPDIPWPGDGSGQWLWSSGAAKAWPDDWTMPWITGITNNRPWRPTVYSAESKPTHPKDNIFSAESRPTHPNDHAGWRTTGKSVERFSVDDLGPSTSTKVAPIGVNLIPAVSVDELGSSRFTRDPLIGVNLGVNVASYAEYSRSQCQQIFDGVWDSIKRDMPCQAGRDCLDRYKKSLVSDCAFYGMKVAGEKLKTYLIFCATTYCDWTPGGR